MAAWQTRMCEAKGFGVYVIVLYVWCSEQMGIELCVLSNILEITNKQIMIVFLKLCFKKPNTLNNELKAKLKTPN